MRIHFSDWYHGTGRDFRYVNGIPGFGRGSTEWSGLAKTKAEAVAMAKYTIDIA
jgi:hypothetical protein